MSKLNIVLNDTLVARLKSKTIYEGECWLYTGGSIHDSGYRRINIDGKTIGVHRLAAAIFHGLNLNDWKQQANHKAICKNKTCWNPEHLYVGNQAQNLTDYLQDKERKRTCPYGHQKTLSFSTNTYICRECINAGARKRRAAGKSK